MTLADVLHLVQRNELLFSVLGIAFVVTMPRKPPPPFDRWPFFVYWWEWFHDGITTFINMRTASSTQASTYRQETPAMTTTQTSETKTDTPAPPKDASVPEK